MTQGVVTADMLGSDVVWRKSTRSGGNGQCVEVACPHVWQKSTRSGGNGECVEVSQDTESRYVYVRDSKNPAGPVLTFTPGEWDAFVGGAKDGEFDLV